MGFMDHGYYGYAFVGARPIQIVSLIVVIGMVANFISEDGHAQIPAPGQVVGTLVIACLALLWTLVSATAYDDTHFPYVATAAVDIVFMIPFIVIAAIFGGPLSSLTCSALPKHASTINFLALPVSSKSNMLFVGFTRSTCMQVMAVWGFVIALCVLFAFSGFAMALLFLGERRAQAAAKGPYPPVHESQIEMVPGAKAMSDADSFHFSDPATSAMDGSHDAEPYPPHPAHTAPGRAITE